MFTCLPICECYEISYLFLAWCVLMRLLLSSDKLRWSQPGSSIYAEQFHVISLLLLLLVSILTQPHCGNYNSFSFISRSNRRITLWICHSIYRYSLWNLALYYQRRYENCNFTWRISTSVRLMLKYYDM